MNAFATYLFRTLECLLGENGINALGKYELIPNNKFAQGAIVSTAVVEVPAIYIRYPLVEDDATKRRMKSRSGIECTIDPNPTIQTFNKKRGIDKFEYYTVTLDQWNPLAALSEAIEIIYQTPNIRPFTSPIVRGVVELGDGQNAKGTAPARAVLRIPKVEYLSPLF